MTVRSRLLAGFAAVIAILLFPGLFAAERLAELQTLAVEGRARHAGALLGLGQMRAALSELDRYERSYVATGDETLRLSAAEELESLTSEYGRLAAAPYAPSVRLLGPAIADLARLTGRVDALMRTGSVRAATEAFGEMEVAFAEATSALTTVTDSINLAAQRDLVRAEAVSATARRDTLMGTLLGLMIALAVATWVSATLTRPLGTLGRAMARVADGRFDPPTDLPVDRRDEIGELSTSFRIMSHRLADLDRMKAEFLGVASHELKTPINTIHGYAELIREEFGDEAPDEYNRMVDGIAEQSRSLARLVDRLMDLSRLETGSYRTQWEQVHVQDLVTGLLRGFEVLARQRDVTLTSQILPSAPDTVEMDLDLVRDEVLGNLLQNALRHTPPGGSTAIVVGGVPQGVVFTVTDSGPGVAEADRDRVFRKYYRGDASVGGTGLGLAIAREIVLLHGGFITLADPEPGRGAQFRVVLPLRPPSAGQPRADEEHPEHVRDRMATPAPPAEPENAVGPRPKARRGERAEAPPRRVARRGAKEARSASGRGSRTAAAGAGTLEPPDGAPEPDAVRTGHASG